MNQLIESRTCYKGSILSAFDHKYVLGFIETRISNHHIMVNHSRERKSEMRY